MPDAVSADPEAAPKTREEPLPDRLDLFQAWLKDSDTLAFDAPAAPRLCPSGDPAAGLMVMTDMPAADDCRSGALLAGEAGQLFDRMMAAIERARNSLYLAPLSCFRSPDGRFPSHAAVERADPARNPVGAVHPRALPLL